MTNSVSTPDYRLDMSLALPSLSLPAYRGSTVGVSVLFIGNVSMPTSLAIQTPVPGHDTLDLPLYSFFVENERANKKVLFDLGLMKGWKEKQPDRESPSSGSTLPILSHQTL